MQQFDPVMYKLLLVITPILLAILAFVGALAVNWLVKINNSLQELKLTIATVSQKHEDLKERVDRLEEKIYP